MRLFGSPQRAQRELVEYYSSDTELYRVEQVTSGRALVEDCRTGVLIDVPLPFLERLRPIRPHHPGAAEERTYGAGVAG
jgi:hypothetical protein